MDITINGATYLTVAQLSETVGIARVTVGSWIKSGAVSHIKRGRGHVRYVPLAEAIRLRLTPVRETLEAGIYRQPAEQRAAVRRTKDAAQRESLATATESGSEWDTLDLCFLIKAYEDGATIREMARQLGRTYSATLDRISYLRAGGEDIGRRRPLDDGSWLPGALSRLTARELAQLISERRAS
jgi:transposase-like protein